MRTSRYLSFFVLICLLASVAPAHAKKATGTQDFRVDVEVQCDDPGLRNRITSFVSSELRRLGDVEITDVNPSYRISIVAISVTLQSGYTAGHAVSVVVSNPLSNLEWALSKSLKQETRQWIAGYLSRNEMLDNHELFVGDEEHLRHNLTDVVSQFDVKQLVPARKFMNMLNDTRSK